MAHCYNCPYYKKEWNERIRCEFATIRPPDKQTLKKFVAEFCASEDNYKSCTFYKLMDEYYERKFSAEQNTLFVEYNGDGVGAPYAK